MDGKTINVNVEMDGKTFQRFAVFESLSRRRIWIIPAVFAVIMSLSAAACFAMRGITPRSVMIGCILLIAGWGLPLVHTLYFIKSLRSQIKTFGLEKPRLVYSLRLSDEPDGIRVSNPGGESAAFEWGGVYKAYRVKGCTYLYVTSGKAFLLPDEQVEGGADTLWAMLSDMLPPEKLLRRT